MTRIKSGHILVGLLILFGIFCVFIAGKGRFHHVRAEEFANHIEREKKHYIPNDTNGVCHEYYETKDGRWSVNGRMPNAVTNTEFVVLTNNKNLSFQDVNQSIVSNDSNDHLNPEMACIVEMR